jgi:protocatechuate 3,4-dioxygenase, alpha subunit
MKNREPLVPTGSQTVGPFFHIGLTYLTGQELATPSALDVVKLQGKVLDRDGVPLPDALLEFWGADSSGAYSGAAPNSGKPAAGFYRAATDQEGNFSVEICKPGPTPLEDGRLQAPHLLVLVFARGLLRHLVTRVYFAEEPANAHDFVLSQVPAERRHTLLARADAKQPRTFQWNVVLQGMDETAFFAW